MAKTVKPKLYIDLVPKTAWCANLRTKLSVPEWKAIAKYVSQQAGHKCQICQGIGPKWPVECHERWHFDVSTHKQYLVGLEALCPACHEATHFGLAQISGHEARAKAQLEKVNGWTGPQTAKHIVEAFHTWEQLSKIESWELDLKSVDKALDPVLGHKFQY